jgi:NADPH:quinone reductase-like Zn-dependent oxidoreductase
MTTPTIPAQMRAVVCRRYGTDISAVLGVERVPTPTPGSGEVLIEVLAAGVDRGAWHLITGRPALARLAFGLRRPRQPVAGSELAGLVVALGDGVTSFAVGDLVHGAVRGAFAEYAVGKVERLARVPEGLDPVEAASLPISGLTALQGLRDHGKVGPGDRVMVHGATGGVGVHAVQLAVALGAEVTAVTHGSKADVARSLGAHHVIARDQVDPLAGTERYDVILDCGGHRRLRDLRRALTPNGRLVIVGSETSGFVLGGLQRTLLATLWSPFVAQRLGTFVAKDTGDDLSVLDGYVVSGALRAVVDRTAPFDEAASVFDDLVAGKVKGKAVLVP